jgi:aminopeptidase N
MAARALRNTALAYLGRVLAPEALEARLADRMARADNLTDRRALLQIAVNQLPESAVTQRLLAEFYERWQSEALVVNQWFTVQASGAACSLDRLKKLVAHPAFEITNPNKVRSVLSTFAGMNQRNFHAADGSGYAYIAERIVELNGINPQMAAALAKPLTRWRRYAGERSGLMRKALMDVAGEDGLSTDVFEVVTKSLA